MNFLQFHLSLSLSLSQTNLIPRLPYHTIILDCGPIGFIDSMGMAILEQVLTTTRSSCEITNYSSQVVSELDKYYIQVLIAAPPTPLCEALNRYGFFKQFSSACLFPTVANAVIFAKKGLKVVSWYNQALFYK